jgi:branched-chain amino acid transport system permease protein
VALSLKYLGAIPLAFLPFIGAVSAALGSLVIGFFLTRVSGITFAMLTVAFSQLLAAIALKWHSVTGGDDGLSISRPDLTLPLIGRIDMFNPSHFYYVVLVLVAVSLWYCRYFLKTPMGNLVVCLRENEERTNFLGYHLPTARLILFIFTGFFAGLAGSLYVLLHEFISVQALGLDMSATPLLMAIIGGVGYFAGPIVGSVVFMFLSKYLSALTNYWLIALGIIFIFIVLFAPAGLIGFCRVFLIRIGRSSSL